MRKVVWMLVVLLAVSLVIFGISFEALAEENEEAIKLLGTIPMSGEGGGLGPPYDRAIRLAVREINEAGIEGFSHIDYKLIDTETSPAALERKLRREIQTWGPHFVGGAALETELRVHARMASEHQIPMFVGGHLSLSKYMPPGEVPNTEWLVYYGYADYFAGRLAGQFFHEMGAEKVAFIGGDYDWGYSNSMGLKSYWMENDQPFEIGPVLYTPLDATDYSTEVAIINDEEPDAIFAPFMGDGWFTFPVQLRDADAMPEIFLYGTTYSNKGSAMITGEYGAENIYTLADHNPESDEWHDFVRTWQDAYGAEAFPEAYTNNHYQMIYWFKEVFEKAGTTDPHVVLETMRETAFQNVCVSPMGPVCPYGSNWGADGAIVQFVRGESELAPDFALTEKLIGIYQTPKMNTADVLEQIGELDRLRSGEEYPKN